LQLPAEVYPVRSSVSIKTIERCLPPRSSTGAFQPQATSAKQALAALVVDYDVLAVRTRKISAGWRKDTV
jgi:hypothetical protein